MGFRFRRRVRILPGIWFNLSKSGGSVSIGGHGATLNLGPHGTRTTVGIPGSGLSYRSPTTPWGHGVPIGSPAPTPPPAKGNHGSDSAAPESHGVLFWLGIVATIAAGVVYLSH
ncbi:MAG TPA: DUF4236 domain-containing protein [Stellaceae bacterium]|nr:DUF4236 domain-containing protein [Stellaceae bacterium]